MRQINIRSISTWLLSIPFSYFILGFLSNFYSSTFEIILLALLIHISTGIFFYFLQMRAAQLYKSRKIDYAILVSLFTILLIFIISLYKTVERFPSLFTSSFFQVESNQTPSFLIGIFLAFPFITWIVSPGVENKITRTRAYQFFEKNLSGILLAIFFFSAYLILASIFNRPKFDVDDIFFDTDGLLWRTRFTTSDYRDYYWRSVHPFVLLIIRPLVVLVSFFLKGDKLSAAFVLTAFTGALCVFLVWYFIKQTIQNSIYALLLASILGASSAHLVFGSLLETYIFLAAVMMIFLVLLLKDRPLIFLIIAGTASFGITITNFIQTAIAYVFLKRNIFEWMKYGLIVAALVIPLSLFNNLIYPDSQPYFFIPSNLAAESGNTFAPSTERASAIIRVMGLHSIVAPDPLILKEEIPFLKVWMFKADPIQLGRYKTFFGKSLAYFWLALILSGIYLFLKNIQRYDVRFPLAFIVILIFNFVLHLQYGKDVFLYAVNWTYAIVLFLAFAWRELAGKKWFQFILLLFFTLLLLNNSRLIMTMLAASALHIK